MRRSALAFALLGALLVGCGGGASHLRTLPAAEASAYDLLPSDAFLVARVDGEAMRATPSWSLLEALLEAEHERGLLMLGRGTDHFYFGIGGLVDAPPFPEDYYDDSGEPTQRPDWANVALLFGGRLPKLIGVVEGDAAAICTEEMARREQIPLHEDGGVRWKSDDGIVMGTVGERLCFMTFEPVLRALLEDGHEQAPVVSRLLGTAVEGDLGIAAGAIELDSPVFRELVDHTGPPGDPSVQRAMIAQRVRRIYDILTAGITSLAGRIAKDPRGLLVTASAQFSDPDRAIMWREAFEIYLEIMTTFFTRDVVGVATYARIQSIVNETHVVPSEDGFSLSLLIADDLVRALIEDQTHHSVAYSEDDGAYAGYEAEESPAVAVRAPLPIGTPAEMVAQLESRADTLDAPGTRELALAYAYLGRFAEAKALIRRRAEHYEPSEASALSATLCELELATGHAAEALSVANAGLTTCRTHGDCAYAALRECRLVARAASGEAAEAIAEHDEATELWVQEGYVEAYQRTRGRVLLAAGRYAEASAALVVTCVQTPSAGSCPHALMLAAEADARADVTADALARSIARADAALAERDVQSLAFAADPIRLEVIRCMGLALRGDVSAAATQICEDAVSHTATSHGESHPLTAEALVFRARQRRAARDEAGARGSLTRADAILATLGPASSVRTDRAALDARTRPRRR